MTIELRKLLANRDARIAELEDANRELARIANERIDATAAELGKRVAAEAEVARLNRRTRCDIDGDDHLADTVSDCRMCGAPQCCPVCCREAFDEAEVARLTAERDEAREQERITSESRTRALDAWHSEKARAEAAEAEVARLGSGWKEMAALAEAAEQRATVAEALLRKALHILRVDPTEWAGVAMEIDKALSESGQEGKADE